MKNSLSVIRNTLNVFKEKTAIVIIFIGTFILIDSILSDFIAKVAIPTDSIFAYQDGILLGILRTILLMLNLSIFLTIIAKNCSIGEATISMLKSIIPILIVSLVYYIIISLGVFIFRASGCIGVIGFIAASFILASLYTRLLFVFHVAVLEKQYLNAMKISMLYVQGDALMIFYRFITASLFFALLILVIFLPIIILYAVIFAHVQFKTFALLGLYSAPLFLSIIKCTWPFIVTLIIYFIYKIYREKLLQSLAQELEEDSKEENV